MVSMATAARAWRANGATARSSERGTCRVVVGSPRTCWRSDRELVERQVLRTSHLDDRAAEPAVVDGSFDRGGDVDDGHEVDRVVAAAEDHALPDELGPQLGERGRSHDRPAHTAGPQVGLRLVLRSEQLHRTVRRRADDRHQHDVGPRRRRRRRPGSRCHHDRPMPESLARDRRIPARPTRRRSRRRALGPRVDGSRTSPTTTSTASPRWRARAASRVEDPDRSAAVDEARDQDAAEPAGTAGDEDHRPHHLIAHRLVDVGGSVVDRLEVEAGPPGDLRRSRRR